MKPTLDDIFLRGVKIRNDCWADLDGYVQYSQNNVELLYFPSGSVYTSVPAFIKSFDSYPWKIYEEPAVEPQLCPRCGLKGRLEEDEGLYFFYLCPYCGLRGQTSSQVIDTFKDWNRLSYRKDDE